MFTNEEIIKIALEQSAMDTNCRVENFFGNKNMVVPFKLRDKSKVYYEEPIAANFVSYGNNVVISAIAPIRHIVEEYVEKYNFQECFEMPYINKLNSQLKDYGYTICFMATYYLPNIKSLEVVDCNFETRILTKNEFANLYSQQWSNALCERRKELDVFCVGAYDGDKLIGLAGCEADCDMMWQIGIDVLPEYRRKGVGQSLTKKMAIEILKRNKVPFYCCAWSNISSRRNAIRSGFVPTWVEMTAKSIEHSNTILV